MLIVSSAFCSPRASIDTDLKLFASIGSKDYFYKFDDYIFLPDICNSGPKHQTLKIFEEERGSRSKKLIIERIQPIDERIDPCLDLLQPPMFGDTKYGRVIKSPFWINGTSAPNLNEYYLEQDDSWVRIDSTSWQEIELSRLLPQGEVWHGMDIELPGLAVEQGVWLPDDANCCPSGGSFTINLGIKNNRFTIEEFRFSP